MSEETNKDAQQVVTADDEATAGDKATMISMIKEETIDLDTNKGASMHVREANEEDVSMAEIDKNISDTGENASPLNSFDETKQQNNAFECHDRMESDNKLAPKEANTGTTGPDGAVITTEEHSNDIALQDVKSNTPDSQAETQSDPGKADTATSVEAAIDLATGETAEEEEETSTLRELMDALGEVDSPGSTCAAGPAKCLPAYPGLRIEGVGHIALPIIEVQAKALAAVAQQAPHGQGMKTVIDTTVSKTWQIEPQKIHLENPAWPVALEQLTAQAAMALGVEASLVRAELYKVLLYEPGGFFKKHRDTEKADGMFATLVVQLPSRYTGGAFVVSHGGEKKEFTLGSGGEASYGCQFVTHYADCEHEIQPVESGYRLALVYSLCYTGGNKYTPTAAAVSDGQRRLKSILDRLPNEKRLFILPLNHQYTTSSLAQLGLNALKGGDRDIQSAIASASQRSWKFIIVLATRTDSESGDGDHYTGFEAYDTEEGYPYLDEAYGPDGSDCLPEGSNCSSGLSLIQELDILNFRSVDDDGIVLASKDEVKEMRLELCRVHRECRSYPRDHIPNVFPSGLF